jgi:hypothetical protein
MQLARAAHRREHAKGNDVRNGAAWIPGSSSLVEEVVRYLRQQDDVIVRLGQLAFHVNNRFTLDFEQLLTRANRMRSRQGKPEFGGKTQSIESSGPREP